MKDGASHRVHDGVRNDAQPGTATVALSELVELREGLHALVRDFDPRACDGDLAKRFVAEFSRLRRLAEAGLTLALAQVERTDAWAHGGSGARSTADWYAKQAGLPLGEAIRTTTTATRLEDLPLTEAAVRDGKLSAAQTATISDAASEAPGAEAELVEFAGRASYRQLRDRASQAKAAAQDEAERAARQQALRGARRWTDDDGMRNYHIKLTPEQAARFEPVWERFINQVFGKARAEGRRDTPEQYAADALVAMAEAILSGTKLTGGTRHALILVDATALHRGHTVAGETCVVDGIGPIDVAAAKDLLGDAVVDILVKDGVDVRTVAHAGRAANRRQKAALLADWECEIRYCGAKRGIEIDHIDPYSNTKITCSEKLGGKCGWHHYLKTHKGWTDGPRGPDGKRNLIPPAKGP